MKPDDRGQPTHRRIRDIASSLVGGSEPAGASIVETATRSLGAVLERWGRNPGLLRFVGGVRQDVLTGRGETVTLAADPGVARRLGQTVRFHVGDAVVGEVPIGDQGEVVSVVEAPAPGLYAVRAEARGGDGAVLAELAGERLLQVTSDRPVALVDAALVVGGAPGASAPDEAVLDALRALHAETYDLAYFDIHTEDRYALIVEAVKERALPPGAVLVHAAARELDTVGVDFVEMYASTAVRRLRASGVPVTSILTHQPGPSDRSRAERVSVRRPTAALALSRDGGLAAEAAQARALLEEKAAADPLDFRLDQTTGSRRIEGGRFAVALDNGVARRRLFEVIDAARASVHVQLYIVRPSRFTEHLVVHLIRRARAGVRVRLMVDALYSEQEVLGRLNPSIRSLTAEPGVDVVAVSPIETREQVTLSRLKRRDHRKLVVVDGTRAFVTGRNASDEYYYGFDEVPVHDHTPHDRIPWLDAHVEVEGPLVTEVQRAFLDTWEEQGGAPVARDDEVLPALAPAGDAAARLVVHRGLSDTNALSMYQAMLECAESHAYVVNDFPFVPAIERAIRAALARGVRVQLLTGCAAARRDDGTFFDAPLHRTLFEYMVKGKLEPLLHAGLEAYELVPPPCETVVARGGRVRPYVHAKLVSIDGRATSIGSANLDATASYWESEANVLVQDPAFARGVEAELAALIEGSLRLDVDSEYFRRERAQRAVVSTLWPGTLYS